MRLLLFKQKIHFNDKVLMLSSMKSSNAKVETSKETFENTKILLTQKFSNQRSSNAKVLKKNFKLRNSIRVNFFLPNSLNIRRDFT